MRNRIIGCKKVIVGAAAVAVGIAAEAIHVTAVTFNSFYRDLLDVQCSVDLVMFYT